MEKVLARRDENWKKLQQYVLDEREQMEVRGLGDVPIWGEVRDYTWYLQDGFFVRSPVKVNGVLIAESERRKYEEDYLRRAKERDKRRGRGGPPAAAPPEAPTPAASDPADVQDFILQTRQPQFVDSAYFLKFKFEPSKYALVGHETFEGRDVLQDRVLPVATVRARAGSAGTPPPAEPVKPVQGRKRRHRAHDEQGLARDDLGRAEGLPDREIHLR